MGKIDWRPISDGPTEELYPGYGAGRWVLGWFPDWDDPYQVMRWRWYHRVDAWCWSTSDEDDDFADHAEHPPSHYADLDPPET